MEDKNLQLERLVFFCDAVVAIAITLLVFNLKIGHVDGGHLTFKDLLQPWHSFLAFLLSFFNIASFWKTHHSFFTHVKKVDEKLLWFNIFWLFSIAILPFSTSLVSDYFFDKPAIFLYSLNTFVIIIFQNMIWDYVAMMPGYIKEENPDEILMGRIRLYCNLDMLNALVAIGISFLNPLVAFILLFTKIPMFIMTGIYLRGRKRTPFLGNPNRKRKDK